MHGDACRVLRDFNLQFQYLILFHLCELMHGNACRVLQAFNLQFPYFIFYGDYGNKLQYGRCNLGWGRRNSGITTMEDF